MNRVRAALALGLLLGVTGCSGVDRRITFRPSPVRPSAAGPAPSRIGPIEGQIARYFPALSRPATAEAAARMGGADPASRDPVPGLATARRRWEGVAGREASLPLLPVAVRAEVDHGQAARGVAGALASASPREPAPAPRRRPAALPGSRDEAARLAQADS
ncbi:MAG: hypothetical protein IRY99_25865, partial [Isosphaeraceae bacterium]|nr:hypothetical protein [Isosphaeraceae bacterium]